MDSRYLEVAEISAILQRGNTVECFLGACSRDGKPGVRWLSLEGTNRISVYIYETADLGSAEKSDLYEFGPLNSTLPFGDSDEELNFADLKGCLRLLGSRFPGSITRLVNEGGIQDEYADFISKGRK